MYIVAHALMYIIYNIYYPKGGKKIKMSLKITYITVPVRYEGGVLPIEINQ